jgi:hypothetical protein
MLTISLDRLFELLDKASEIEVAVPAAALTADDLSLILVDNSTYWQMIDLLEGLAPDETYELLALGFLARNAAGLDEWQAMIEQARAVPEERLVDELIPMLLLTDEIERALERLGYGSDDGWDEDEKEEIED